MFLFAVLAHAAPVPPMSSGQAAFCSDAPVGSILSIASREPAKLAGFYTGVLGFKTIQTVHGEGGLSIHILQCGALKLDIGPADTAAPPKAKTGRSAGIFQVGWTVRDFEAAHGHLVDMDVPITFGPRADPQGLRFVDFDDPAGNEIRLLAPIK